MAQLRKLARAKGLDLTYLGGTNHEKWQMGPILLVIPRHRELHEYTARGILRLAESATSQESDNEND